MAFLARYAENLYWLARYIERTASLASLIEIHMSYDRGRDADVSWEWLVKLHSDEERFAESYDDPSFDNVIRFYVADLQNPGSVRSALRSARENARALRAVIPTEMWIQINQFHNRLRLLSESDLHPIRLSRFCEQIKNGCYAQVGVAESTLYRDEGWRFFRLGLMIERADQTSRMLDVKFAQLETGDELLRQIADATFWSLVLRSACAYQSFHRFEQRGAEANRVAKFLLTNGSHPRSVAYAVGQIQMQLGELNSGYGLPRISAAEQQNKSIAAILQQVEADPNVAANLHGYNDQLQRGLIELSSGLGTMFFGYPLPEKQFQSQSQS